jgi:pimeloyl-ACP methyl ester carboxylesterase
MIFQADGAELYYEVHGEGEPLLWLHGFLGSGADWRHVFGEPPAGFRLIAPDLRGHGDSSNPSGVFTHRQSARDVLGLLRHLGLDRAGVKAIGVSAGGITLLHMATAEPACVEAMVLVSAAMYFPSQARSFQRNFSDAMLGATERDLMRRRHKRGEAQIERLYEQARAFADSYDDVNFTPPLLSTITARTLLVTGDRDPLYPLSMALEMRVAIRRSYLWVVPNGGHVPIFGDAAPRFAETALDFLRRGWSRL